MEQYRYDFSVVMAVYNVEEYLREAVESLIHQTIGFSHIQLIMVDDGSTDESGKICDEYQIKHPENVVVIHKENGGVSSARNTGLPYVKGKYLNFMDSDDKFRKDAFKKVFNFFEIHRLEIDVAAVPMRFFEGMTGEHYQNKKFKLGSDLIDLFETPYVINFHVASSFVRAEAAYGLFFDERLRIAEDAKYMLGILMKKMKLGLVSQTIYWYRKRKNGAGSAIQSATFKPEWYTASLRYFSNWALETAEREFGEIPKFVQNEVMYDLQWKLRQRSIPSGVLTDEEEVEYKTLLIRTACRIDDDVILKQDSLESDWKLFVLFRKYGYSPGLRIVPATERVAVQEVKQREKPDLTSTGDIELRYGDIVAALMSDMRTILEFIKFDEKNKTCELEGYHVVFGVEASVITPVLIIDRNPLICERRERKEKNVYIGKELISEAVGFRCVFPLTDTNIQITPAVYLKEVLVKRNRIYTGAFFPVSQVYENSYYLTLKHMLRLYNGSLMVTKKPFFLKRMIHECRFLAEIWGKNLLGGRKAVGGRLYYHFVKPLKHRRLWIVSDRTSKADDNGEALFHYLKDNPPADTRVVFAISKESVDYKRMSGIGDVVDAMSFRHKLMHLLCDVNISAHAENTVINPFFGYHDALRDLLQHQRFVFLQHGITVNDLSGWLNRFNKDISGFITVSQREADSIEEGNYYYSKDRIWLTGFPRYDRLYCQEKNIVTVMPTWRRYLLKNSDPKTGKWIPLENFQESSYYHFYDSLMNSKRLLQFLESKRYILQFFLHPNIRQMQKDFHHDPRVVFLPEESSYRNVYAESKMVITDYSSASYDFSSLRKPVIYCQFDKEEFFSGKHTVLKGYFDYEKDGFGEVVYDLESTIDLIIEYVSNDCRLKEFYRKRIDSFFAFHDRNNCRRVTEKILSLSEKC